MLSNTTGETDLGSVEYRWQNLSPSAHKRNLVAACKMFINSCGMTHLIYTHVGKAFRAIAQGNVVQMGPVPFSEVLDNTMAENGELSLAMP